MAYRDPCVRKQRDRERVARRGAERIEAGLCPRCGERSPAPERTVCNSCAEKRNRASRIRRISASVSELSPFGSQ